MEKNLGKVRTIFILPQAPPLLQAVTLFKQDQIFEFHFEVGQPSVCFSVPYQSVTRDTNDV